MSYNSYTDLLRESQLGMPTVGRSVTATLFVSPNGNNSDGSTWDNAYNTIQGALDAASTDADDCTAILLAPHATYYDINTTGDPTWTGNYEITNTHRLWSPIRNTHNDATSIMKFTGKVSISDLALFSTDNGVGGSVGGVTFTQSGYRIRRCGFNSEGVTHAVKAIHIDGSGANIRGGITEDVEILGHATHTTGIYMDNAKINNASRINMHDCLKGVQIVHVDSDQNYFNDLDIGLCAIGLDLDAGNGQHFRHVNFHGCTTNVDDEVGDHVWENIHGQFPIDIEPDNTDGVNVACAGGADTWGADTEIRAAATSTKPFRIVGTHCEPNANRIYQVRFSADSGSTFYDQLQMSDSRRESVAAPSGTEFIFNAGTRISASARDEDGGGDVNIWVEIQEI